MSDTTTAPAQPNPDTVKELRDWMTQINAAEKRDKKWKEEAKSYYSRYENEKAEQEGDGVVANAQGEGAYNLLYSNTSILQPALYSNTPQADVRRRFRDKDPLGKQAANVLERGLDYSIAQPNFDDELDDAVFDMLIAGRGVLRVKYEPTIETKSITASDGTSSEYDEITEESTVPELVPWDKFRILGNAKRWAEVGALCFDHDFTRDELVKYFGDEIGNAVPLGELSDEDKKDLPTDTDIEKLKTARVHEIWDKDTKEVLFLAPSYKTDFLDRVDDPLKLRNFFPTPRPMYYVKTTKGLVPVPLTRLYRRQLKELDFITVRIAKVIDAMRVRGLYPGGLTELAAVAQGDDNDFIPVENMAAILATPGGLERAIWLWPIEKLPLVLQQLYASRDQIKQAIYEIIGISDILRGATKASETLGAQRIKAQSGSLRISKAQKEVARYVAEILNLMSEIMVDRYSPETWAAMTNLKMPSGQDKKQAQDLAAQAPPGTQLPPDVQTMLAQPSWDEVLALLKDDQLRCYRIDIETDSTVADQIDQDMDALTKLLAGIGQIIQGSLPAVQAGLMSPDVVKEIILSVARRARLGSAIEDALENGELIPQHMTAPPPGAPPQGQPPPAGPPAPPQGGPPLGA